jgi:hypothetical protein
VSWEVVETYGSRLGPAILSSIPESVGSQTDLTIGNETHSNGPVFTEWRRLNSRAQKRIQPFAFNEDPAALMSFIAGIGLQQLSYRTPSFFKPFGQLQTLAIAVLERDAQIFDLALFFCELVGIPNDLGRVLLNSSLALLELAKDLVA